MRENPEANKNPETTVKILVTAGPTREALDPIRYISNHSTGEMGYSIAAAGADRGFKVSLISGPTQIPAPFGVETVNVTTAREMRDEVMERAKAYDCLIMTAAVCDFRPAKRARYKIKKTGDMTLRLLLNPDILLEAAGRKSLVKVGFALETADPAANGRKKMREKNLDLMIVNEKNENNDPFGPGNKEYTMIRSDGSAKEIKGLEKRQMAGIIIDEVEKLIQRRRNAPEAADSR